MNSNEFAEAVSQIKDIESRGRAAELIGSVCYRHSDQWNWTKWYEACCILPVLIVEGNERRVGYRDASVA
jgi:hypothetical protein